MKTTKLWSVLLAFVLLCGCVLGILFTGANAEGEVVYGVGYTEGIDEDKQFNTIQDAFAAVETAIDAGEWTEGNTLVIKFAGTIEAKAENSELVFGQKTIFTSVGKKLPITIYGTEASKASTVKVTAEKIACANDYTFENLTLDLHSYVVKTATFSSVEYNVGASFFAGSGNVTLKNLPAFPLGTHVFGDNYTAEAFEGWTEADVEALKDEDGCILTSASFTGTGFNSTETLGKTSTNSIDAGPCAVGATRNSTTGEDAYAAVISENITITPANTKAMLEITSGTLKSRVGGYMAEYPARVHTAIIKMTGGTVNSIAGDEAGGHVGNKIENGNIEVIAENCSLSNTGLRILYGGGTTMTDVSGENKYGNITIQAENLSGKGSHYIGGTDNLEVAGKVTVTLDSCNAVDGISYIGQYGARGVEVNISNATLKEYSATRISAAKKTVNCEIKTNLTNVIYNPAADGYNLNSTGYRAHGNADSASAAFNVEKVTNVFTGCTFKTKDLYSLGSATDVGSVSTVIDSCTFETEFYNASDSTKASPTVGNVTTTVRETVEGAANSFPGSDFYCLRSGTTVTGNVVNNIEGGTFDYLYGVFKASVGGTITNNVSGITVKTFYGLYDYDSTNEVALNHTYGGGVTTKVGDNTVATNFTTAYYVTIPSLTTTVKGSNYNADTEKGIKITNFYGSRYDTVSGEVSTEIDGGSIKSYYGTSSGSAGTVKNTVKAGLLGTYAETDGLYYGSYKTPITRLENSLQGGSVGNFRGATEGTIGSVQNSLTGANTNGYNGTYNTTVTNKVETEVTDGSHSSFYVIYGGSASTLGDVITEISGGTFSGDVMLGGYGGKSVKSVTNTISGDAKFTGTGKMLSCGTGNKNWTGQVLGHVTNNFEGGTFSCTVYGGAAGGCIQGNIYNNIKSGTFKNVFYGGNRGPTYYKSSSYSYYNSFLNKGVEGTIYNTVGENNKPETAPVFEKTFYGGDCGILEANAYANESNCTIENTVYNGTFTNTYFGGNSKDAYISKQITHEPYSITLNITNNIHGGTFKASYFGGSAASAHDATEGTTIAAGVSSGTITNNIYRADITKEYMGGIGTGKAPMTIDVVNNLYDVTLHSLNNYLGHGTGRETTGTITNTIYDGFTSDKAYVYGAGNGVVNPPEGKTVAVTNTINGGSFYGFWGAGGGADLVVNGDIETAVYGGTFATYDNNNLINGVAGGPRNGTLNGKAVLNIYGGTFIGQVCGGTFLGSADYRDRLINGSTELNIYGGDFKRSVFACSTTSTIYATEGSVINVIPTEGKKLAFYAQVKGIDEFDASADVVVNLGKNTLLEIASLTGTLQVNQTQQWLARTYVTVADADAAIVYTTSKGANGSASLIAGETTVELRGNGIDIKAATLLLSDKIKIKLMFAEEDINTLPADYEFTFTADDGTVLGNVNADNIGQAKDGYYTVVLSTLGLGDFDMAIACEGNYLYSSEMTVIGLADQGAKHYTETAPNAVNAQLFKTIADLGRIANEQEALYGEPVTHAVNWTASKNPEAVDPARLNMQTIGLVMTDAIGIRLTGETVAADTPLQFWVNGTNVTSFCVISRSETADETSGKFSFTVDMYVKVSMMARELNIAITDDAEATMFTMTVRVDALAEKIYAYNQNEITKHALAYIQAADTYIKAQEA